MHKTIRNISMIAATIITISSNAGYLVKMPLEVPQGGALPYNTIIIGTAVTEPVFDTPDPLPTDNDVVCEFNMTTSLSVIAEGTVRDGNGNWTSYKDAYYQGQKVVNGFKGAEMQTQNDENAIIGYYEVCIKGEPMFSNQNNEVPSQDWDQDDCRFNKDVTGVEYSWVTVPTNDGRMAFANASLGSFGSITANSGNITFPAGTITVPEGKILPEDNQRIIMGKVAFDRGNYNGTRNMGNDVFQSEYAVCKKTAK